MLDDGYPALEPADVEHQELHVFGPPFWFPLFGSPSIAQLFSKRRPGFRTWDGYKDQKLQQEAGIRCPLRPPSRDPVYAQLLKEAACVSPDEERSVEASTPDRTKFQNRDSRYIL